MSIEIKTIDIKPKLKTIFLVNKKDNTITEIPFLGFTNSGRVKLPRRKGAVKPSTTLFFYTEYEEKAKEHLKRHLETKERNAHNRKMSAKWETFFIWKDVRRNYETVKGKMVNGRLHTKSGIIYRLGNLNALVTQDRKGVDCLRDMAINSHRNG